MTQQANSSISTQSSSRGTEMPNPPPPHKGPLRIGVSACVVGKEVRFNGGHKLSRFVHDELGVHVEFVPVCPEVEMGLPVPRETMRLVRIGGGAPRLMANKSGNDLTERMLAFAQRKTKELEKLDLCGFIVQKGSPSCGMERVKVYPPGGGMPQRDGRGLFTQELMRRSPRLPVEEDGRLNDPILREHFLVRILANRRLRDLFASDWQARDLIEFHSREKLLILAHADYRPLGRLVANRADYTHEEWGARYQEMFLDALSKPPSIGKHVNVLQHVAGYFRKGLDQVSRAEMSDLIESYRNRLVPLIVPLTLLKHHVRSLGLGYLDGQSYLRGNPLRLVPQNHLAAS
jgi:uncharacterized protein YbbK (DUF523 family)/uncharacterized protein YbgA (DUF1722 family)